MKFAAKLVVESLKEFAASGFTIEETAVEIGESYHYVASYVRRYGLKFLRSGYSKADDRSREMAASYKNGQTLLEIGKCHGVTRERVRQIISKHHGMTGKKGGQCVRAKKRRIISQAKRDAAALKKWGCTFSQYAMLRQMRKPTGAFTGQKRNAKVRGIGWELTLWQWWTIWQVSGHWEERGRGRGYHMCRRHDSGPYSVDNVYIATGVENMQDYWADVASGLRTRGSNISEQAA